MATMRIKAPLVAGLVAGLLATITVRPADALTVQQCVSDNNDLYVIVTTSSGSIGTQVTSVAIGQFSSCSLSETGASGAVLSALATTTGPLLPTRRRTAILSGFTTNAVSCANFDPAAAGGAGILTLPGGTRTVSVDAPSTTEPLTDVTTAGGGVPAAVDISTSRTIAGPIQCAGNAMVFPFEGTGNTISDPTTGEVMNQSITLDDTSGTRMGNPTSQPTGPDGFLLRGDCSAPSTCQIIVFTARPNGATAYGVAAAGNTVNSNLEQSQTEGNAQNGVFVQPSPTPTRPPLSSEAAPATSPAAIVAIALLVVLLQYARIRRRVESE